MAGLTVKDKLSVLIGDNGKIQTHLRPLKYHYKITRTLLEIWT